MGLSVIQLPADEPPPTEAVVEAESIEEPQPEIEPAEAPPESTDADPGLRESEPPSGDSEQNSEVSHETDANIDQTQRLNAGQPSPYAEVRTSAPLLRSCGGTRRILVVSPPDVSRQRVLEADSDISEASTTFVDEAGREMVVCHEVDEVPMKNVVAFLTGSRCDYLEIADRLHTRIDVDWTPLED